jgi:hypothetical protein
MSPKSSRAPIPEDGVDATETVRLTDQSPRFKKLTPDEEMAILMEPESGIPPHALDGASPNSKLRVIRNGNATQENALPKRLVVLCTPEDGALLLPHPDQAYGLPIGTTCYRTPAGHYQLKLPPEYPWPKPIIGGRAADIIDFALKIVRGEVTPEPEE